MQPSYPAPVAPRRRRLWPWVLAAAVLLAAVGTGVGLAYYAVTDYQRPHGLAKADPAGYRACQAADVYLHQLASEEVAAQLAAPDVAAARTEAIRAAGSDLHALRDACVDAGYDDMPDWR